MNRKEEWRKEAGENVSQNESKVRKLFRFPGQSKLEVCLALALITVADPDLLIKGEGRGGWCGHPDPEIRPQFGLKIRGGEAGPPGPLPWIRHWKSLHSFAKSSFPPTSSSKLRYFF